MLLAICDVLEFFVTFWTSDTLLRHCECKTYVLQEADNLSNIRSRKATVPHTCELVTLYTPMTQAVARYKETTMLRECGDLQGKWEKERNGQSATAAYITLCETPAPAMDG